jgi:hypothetical protein
MMAFMGAKVAKKKKDDDSNEINIRHLVLSW